MAFQKKSSANINLINKSMEGITTDYIKDAIVNLVGMVGLKDNADEQRLVKLLRKNEVKECIQEIAKCLGIPITIRLSWVPQGYKTDGVNYYGSKGLVTTSRSVEGWKGTEGITAQVSVPSSLPLYGTKGLNDFPIDVQVSKGCTNNPLTFIAVMAHELSHVLLHSLFYKEADNEIYTDLTAMILGFADITKDGRVVVSETVTTNQTTTQTTTYGYLSDSQFNFAYNEITKQKYKYQQIKTKLDENLTKLQNKVTSITQLINTCDKKFQLYLMYLDKSFNTKIDPTDLPKLSAFHQTNYLKNVQSEILDIENKARELIALTTAPCRYNNSYIGEVDQYTKEIQALEFAIDREKNQLNEDMAILKNYMSFRYRLKIFWDL